MTTHPNTRTLHGHTLKLIAGAALLGLLTACGGGGGSSGASSNSNANNNNASNNANNNNAGNGALYFDAPFAPSSSLKDQCFGTLPKQFIRSYLDETYLWPEQVQRRDANSYKDVSAYFTAIRAPSIDKFSYSVSVQDADGRQSGVSLDVGIDWMNVNTDAAPQWRIARIEPNSPAAAAGLMRGDTLIGTISNNMQTSTSGPYYYNFTYRRANTQVDTYVSLVPREVQSDFVGDLTVLNKNNKKIGYLAFEGHYGDAQDQLIDAINDAKSKGINELVLDLRYNSGGRLYIANSLASMIAPASKVSQNAIFTRTIFNSKLQALPDYANDFTTLGSAVSSAEVNAKYAVGTAFPNLNLNRVYVLTTKDTCSASESIINGLRGVGMDVHIVGEQTCGKPYGMYRRDNCNVAFFPINFKLVNALNQGDYENGFAPTCVASDDLNYPRGGDKDSLLNAALTHIDTGICPPASHATKPAPSAWAQMSPTQQAPGYRPPQRWNPPMALMPSRPSR